MKFDSRLSAPINPIFRVLAIIIGISMLFTGAAFFIDGLISEPFEFDSDFKVGISGTLCGLLMLVAGIKGNLPKWMDSEEREKAFNKKLNEGKVATRKICLRSLSGLILSVLFLALMFIETKGHPIFWWFTIALSIFIAYLYYLSFTIILESKGFNHLLALTFIFPLLLLIIGVVNPKKFEKMNMG